MGKKKAAMYSGIRIYSRLSEDGKVVQVFLDDTGCRDSDGPALLAQVNTRIISGDEDSEEIVNAIANVVVRGLRRQLEGRFGGAVQVLAPVKVPQEGGDAPR